MDTFIMKYLQAELPYFYRFYEGNISPWLQKGILFIFNYQLYIHELIKNATFMV